MSSQVDALIARDLAEANKTKNVPRGTTPSLKDRTLDTARNIVDFPGRQLGMDVAGMGLGGTGATLLAGPEAEPVGQGAGYTVSQILGDYLNQFVNKKPMPEFSEEMKTVPRRMLEGTGMGAAGKYLVGPALKFGAKKFTQAAPALTEFATNVPQKLTKLFQESGLTPAEFFKKYPGTQAVLERISKGAGAAFRRLQGPAAKAGEKIGEAQVGLEMKGANVIDEASRVAKGKPQARGTFYGFNKTFDQLNKLKSKMDPRDFLVKALNLKKQIQDSIHVGERFAGSEFAQLGKIAEHIAGWVKEISPEYAGLEARFSALKPGAEAAGEMAQRFLNPIKGADLLRNSAEDTSGTGLETSRALEKASPKVKGLADKNVASERLQRALPQGRFGKLAVMRAPATIGMGLLGSKASKGHPVLGSLAGVAAMLAGQSPRVVAEIVARTPRLLLDPTIKNIVTRVLAPGAADLLGDDSFGETKQEPINNSDPSLNINQLRALMKAKGSTNLTPEQNFRKNPDGSISITLPDGSEFKMGPR